MAFHLHPHIRRVLEAGGGPQGSSRFGTWRPGDVPALRAVLDEGLAQLRALPETPAVHTTPYTVDRPGAPSLPMRWYRREGTRESAPDGPAVVFFHGGARIAGSVELYDPLVRTLVDWAGVPFLSVDYRLAPEATGSAAMDDGLRAVEWLLEHHPELGVDPRRIAVMGDSAGGGVAAGVAVLARDAGITLARQILVYPMLDDRTVVPDPQLGDPPPMFTYEFNRTAWDAVRDDEPDDTWSGRVAAPARVKDLGGVAPAVIEVGEMDIFRDEDVRYALALWAVGVSTELHVHPARPHAFDVLLTGSVDAEIHRAERVRVLQSF